VVDHEHLVRDQLIHVEAEGSDVLRMSSVVSSKVMRTPGSPYWMAPRMRNSTAKRDLPQPAEPQTQRGPSGGDAAFGDVVEADDAGGDFLQLGGFGARLARRGRCFRFQESGTVKLFAGAAKNGRAI